MSTETNTIQYIPVDELHPHPDNPRKNIGDVTELAESIHANGILQNLTVIPNIDGTDGYTVIIGHRRLAAARMAGLKAVPCVVTEMDRRQQLHTMLSENIQRTDLTVYEQAQGFQLMLDMGDTVETIAEKSGFSSSTIRRRVKLLELDSEEFKKSEQRGATLDDYAKLDKLKSDEAKNRVLKNIGTSNFNNSLRAEIEAEKIAERKKKIIEKLAEFATEIFAINRVGDEDVPMDYLKSYFFYKDQEVEVPANANERRYFYYATSGGISLYTERSKAQQADIEKNKAEKQQKEQEYLLKQQLAIETTNRHARLRADFVRQLSNSACKKHIADISAAVTVRLLDGFDWNDRPLNPKIITEYTNKDIADGLEREWLGAETQDSPEKALLIAYCTYCESQSLKYWGTQYSGGSRKIVHSDDKRLDKLYGLLCDLGYELSDEEKEMQNGTHEIFKEEEQQQ